MRSAAALIVASGVRSSCETSETNWRWRTGEPLHLLDLMLEGVGHVVEALPEHRDLVVAVDGHALVEVAVGDEPGHLGAGAHRGDDEAGDDPCDGADEDDEDEGGDGIERWTKSRVPCCSRRSPR